MPLRIINAADAKPEREAPRRLRKIPRRIVRDTPVNPEYAAFISSQKDKDLHRMYLTTVQQQADNKAVRSIPRTELEILKERAWHTKQRLLRQREEREKNMAIKLVKREEMKPAKTSGGFVANLSDIVDAWTLVQQNKIPVGQGVEVTLSADTIKYLKDKNPDLKPVNAAVNLFRRRFEQGGKRDMHAYANATENTFTIEHLAEPRKKNPPVARKAKK